MCDAAPLHMGEHDPLLRAYHDEEWGVPERDCRALWEKLMLDGFQAGLSWITILRKREAFRRAFQGFDPTVVAQFGASDVARLVEEVSANVNPYAKPCCRCHQPLCLMEPA